MIRDEVRVFYPKEPLLREHIAYYYFLETDESFHAHYFSFPNTITSFNIHREVKAEISENRIKVSHDPMNEHLIIVQGRYTTPLEVELAGMLDKVTIGFKPLGIGHFMAGNYGDIAPSASQVFTAWANEPEYPGFIKAFYKCDNAEKRIEILEAFLLSLYHSTGNQETMAEAFALIADIDTQPAISAIARHLGLNERTFSRMVRRSLGTSADAFRQICRFRKSMNAKLFSDQFISLSQACYQANYYDQAYFNKLYRKATGTKPGSFFKDVATFAEGNLIFNITA
ncbi:helix-turn-helix domain-containing protein [Pedobacter aquatilis]|uniref:helix-turn-helix domain-containing protein n=1 Tax=Pedobacter aquatilis TaxID=351343 RepID=UPI0029309F78|nr:helix-turn-helix domain-containing protein [Pedobacter aquatilis]